MLSDQWVIRETIYSYANNLHRRAKVGVWPAVECGTSVVGGTLHPWHCAHGEGRGEGHWHTGIPCQWHRKGKHTDRYIKRWYWRNYNVIRLSHIHTHTYTHTHTHTYTHTHTQWGYRVTTWLCIHHAFISDSLSTRKKNTKALPSTQNIK